MGDVMIVTFVRKPYFEYSVIEYIRKVYKLNETRNWNTNHYIYYYEKRFVIQFSNIRLFDVHCALYWW